MQQRSPNRIRQLRQQLGWTQDDLAKRVGTTPVQISRLERGQRSLTVVWMERLATAFDCNTSALLLDYEPVIRLVPLVGYVGAGDLYYPDPEHGPWVGFEEVEAPPGMAGIVAVRVRGRSMEPVYRDGDLLFFKKPDGFDPESCIGRDCVVQVRDGPAYVKRLERQQGKYWLVSYNPQQQALADVQVEWAEPVLWVKRR